jgi:hypothetical protein
MLIDYDNKAVFIHIPKTAGISVTACLKYTVGSSVKSERSELSYSLLDPPQNLPDLSSLTHITEHSGINDILAGGFSNIKDINQYFVFTVIRNPWGQLLSYYNFFKKMQFKGFEDITFETFIKLLKTHEYPSPSHYGFIYDSKGYKRVDEIIYLEDFDNQWKQKVHKNLPMYPERVNSLLNNSQKPFYDYRDAYTEEMIDIVSEVRKKDIEIFGYTFEGGPTQVPSVKIPDRIEPYEAKTNWVTNGEPINENNAPAHGIILTDTLKKLYKAVDFTL